MVLLLAHLNGIRHAQEEDPQLIAKPLPESARTLPEWRS
jgi:hypothetical protein